MSEVPDMRTRFATDIRTETKDLKQLSAGGPHTVNKLLNIRTEHCVPETLFVPAAVPPR